jgi:HK97 gp10 family phage protein
MARSIDDCKELFEQLPAKVGLKFLRRAGRKGAMLIRDDASRRAPRLTGALANNMTISTKKETNESITVSVGPTKREFYGRFQEKGTKFINARPFLEPAIQTKGDEAASVFGNELANEIENHFS